MWTEGSMFPLVQSWHADSAICGRTGYGYYIEPFLHGFERFVVENAFASDIGIFIECLHFLECISFCKNGYIDALFRTIVVQEVFMRCDVWISFLLYQYIVWMHDVFHGRADIAAWVEQGYFYFNRLKRVGKEKCIFKSFSYIPGFVRFQPFLEEWGERGSINSLSAGCIAHNNLPVALQREFRQMMLSSCPGGEGG